MGHHRRLLKWLLIKIMGSCDFAFLPVFQQSDREEKSVLVSEFRCQTDDDYCKQVQIKPPHDEASLYASPAVSFNNTGE